VTGAAALLVSGSAFGDLKLLGKPLDWQLMII
jgi:hypothetical protein